MKIYLVGDQGPEHCHVESIHRTYMGALKAFQNHGTSLIKEAKRMFGLCKKDKTSGKSFLKMYKQIINKLAVSDPKKIDNYPHDTPFIDERKLED